MFVKNRDRVVQTGGNPVDQITDVKDVSEVAEVAEPPGRTAAVVALLAAAAGLFSYLGAYALPGALAAEGVIAPFPPGRDPRGVWWATSFAATLATLAAGVVIGLCVTGRQARVSENDVHDA